MSMGIALGAVFGLFQWFVLKNYADRAYQWIVGNALAWGVALTLIYLFASIPTETTSWSFNILMGILGGAFAGFSLGAITGIYLISLKRKV